MNPSLVPAGLAVGLTAYALQAALVLGVGLLLPDLFRLRDPRACLYYWQGLLLAVRIATLVATSAGLIALTAILGILAFPMTGTAWAADKPVQVGGDVQPPQPIHPMVVDYPAKEKFLKIEGQVTSEVVINEQGKVVSVEVKKSSGNANLDYAAAQSIWRQAFVPATRNGKPVAVFYYLVIGFQVDPGETIVAEVH